MRAEEKRKYFYFIITLETGSYYIDSLGQPDTHYVN